MRTANVIAESKTVTDSATPETINEVLRNFRTGQSVPLSVNDVAEALRYPGQTPQVQAIRNAESGTFPSLILAVLLARFYGSTVEDLFGHMVQNPPDEITPEMDAANKPPAGTGKRGRPSKAEQAAKVAGKAAA